jgi:hypothetical protein
MGRWRDTVKMISIKSMCCDKRATFDNTAQHTHTQASKPSHLCGESHQINSSIQVLFIAFCITLMNLISMSDTTTTSGQRQFQVERERSFTTMTIWRARRGDGDDDANKRVLLSFTYLCFS